MNILSCITLENGVNMTFEIIKNKLWFEMDEPTDKEMMVTIYEVLSNNTGQRDEVLQQLTQKVASLPEEFGQNLNGDFPKVVVISKKKITIVL